MSKEVITLTFGDMAENHVGMEQIGKRVSKGFQLLDFVNIQKRLNDMDIETEIYKLSDKDLPQAYVLVIRNCIDKLMGQNGSLVDLTNEQKKLDWDKKAKIYGRVVNKNARWNLCFDDKSREPDYANGKGRIISFDNVPLLSQLRTNLTKYFGLKAADLKVEGNYYYDINKCGIGYHGDSERRKVIGVRLGNIELPLYFQWYQNGNKVGDQIKINIQPGDIYIMDEKSVGTDWKQKKIATLRHATGANKFVCK